MTFFEAESWQKGDDREVQLSPAGLYYHFSIDEDDVRMPTWTTMMTMTMP